MRRSASSTQPTWCCVQPWQANSSGSVARRSVDATSDNNNSGSSSSSNNNRKMCFFLARQSSGIWSPVQHEHLYLWARIQLICNPCHNNDSSSSSSSETLHHPLRHLLVPIFLRAIASCARRHRRISSCVCRRSRRSSSSSRSVRRARFRLRCPPRQPP